MNMQKLVFVCFITASLAICDRERIISCFRSYVDTNGDMAIDIPEWDHFIANNECAMHFTKIGGATLMDNCDIDGDLMLNETDYDNHASCAQADAIRSTICTLCDTCDADE